MAIFKNNNNTSSFTRTAFTLPTKSNKKFKSLEEYESSLVSTATRKQTQEYIEPRAINGRDGRSKPTTPKVTFQSTASMRKVARAKDLVQDPSELWYTANEYHRISKKALAIIRAVDNGRYQVETEPRLCIRGLERHLATSKHTVAAVRNGARSSVFEAQSKQLATGEKNYDDERISNIYMEFSISAQMEAHARGLSDAREAEKCLEKTTSRRNNNAS